MATRIGIRFNPVSGGSISMALRMELGFAGLTLQDEDENQIEIQQDRILDAGGGVLGLYGTFNDAYGLKRTGVSPGSPWTIWFNPPEGRMVYAAVIVDIYGNGVGGWDFDDTRIRLLREDDGIETVIFNIVSPSVGDVGVTGIQSEAQDTIDEVFGGNPPGYSNFWTGFNRTRENAPT